MKANNGSGNNEKRDTWETPKELWDKLNKQYKFTFDCCANSLNSKCGISYTNNFNFFDIESLKFDVCWINPPFSKALEMFIHFFRVVNKGVAIYRCDNFETKLWQDIIFKNASWVFIPKGRVIYGGFVGKIARFPSALIGYNVPPPKNIEGVTLNIQK